jgi:hypothetical protein
MLNHHDPKIRLAEPKMLMLASEASETDAIVCAVRQLETSVIAPALNSDKAFAFLFLGRTSESSSTSAERP